VVDAFPIPDHASPHVHHHDPKHEHAHPDEHEHKPKKRSRRQARDLGWA
jgi:hypothetical protein